MDNFDYETPKINPKKEFGEISKKKGYIRYDDKNSNIHDISVNM